jgi:cytochrome c6
MKKLMTIVALCLSFLLMAALPAYAADPVAGGKIFTANCAACHSGGNNLVISTKNLQKETLEKYGMFSMDAVQSQVTNGKNAMPAFGGRLSEAQIENVASYVLQQAENGWS